MNKIHRVLKFKQSDWMKKDIDYNTHKKEKVQLIILTKIFLNQWSSLSMERQWKIYEKRINVRLVSNVRDFLKYTSRPAYIVHKIFDEDYAAIYEIKPI